MTAKPKIREDDIAADLQGIDPGQRDNILSSIMESEGHDEFEVYPENWKAVQLFILLGTQWNVGPMGGFVGLRYESVESIMRISLIPVKNRLKLLHALRVMEFAVLDEMAKRTS